MVVEASLMIEKGNGSVGSSGFKVVKKKRKSKVVRRKMKRKIEVVPPAGTLQKLFDTCHEIFKGHGTVPSSEDVQKLSLILDNMVPEDVGLSRNLHFFDPESVVEGNPRVTNATIYQCQNFSMCLFFLPAASVIPLHNHPEMTVFSKLLLGSMHIKAYDWVVDIDNSNNPIKSDDKPRLARLKANQVFTAPCNTSVLYPTSGGNIHEFRAVTPCAVLDVLGPPYSKDDGRDCSYYRDFPFSAFSNDESPEEDGTDCGWLEEIEVPEESEMDVVTYMGPKVY